MSTQLVEGLTELTGPMTGNLKPHKFSLPTGFPSQKYASKWAEEGNEVVEASQPEVIGVANVSAAGWQVYKVIDIPATDRAKKLAFDAYQQAQLDLPADKRDRGDSKQPKVQPIRAPYERIVGKKKFILMFRPRALQEAITKIYADTSRQLVSQEVRGETARANENNDPGILTNADLKKFTHFEQEFDDSEQGIMQIQSQGLPTRLQEADEMNVE